MRTDTDTLISAMRILSREIHCDDGVATAAIAEAADRMEELRLTDAEREAIGNVLHHIATRADHLQREAHDLRGLLERLG